MRGKQRVITTAEGRETNKGKRDCDKYENRMREGGEESSKRERKATEEALLPAVF